MRWIWVTVFLLLPATVVHAGTLHGGVQAKYVGGEGEELLFVGLWGELHLSERFYLHGSASPAIFVTDLSVGPGIRLGKWLDVFVRFHLVVSSVGLVTLWEPGVRLRLRRWLWLEGGVIRRREEDRWITLPNLGLLVDITAFFRREAD